MTDVLGFPLDEALCLLTNEGYTLETLESRSRRGVEGTDKRVIRQITLGNGHVQLVYAVFMTELKQ